VRSARRPAGGERGEGKSMSLKYEPASELRGEGCGVRGETLVACFPIPFVGSSDSSRSTRSPGLGLRVYRGSSPIRKRPPP